MSDIVQYCLIIALTLGGGLYSRLNADEPQQDVAKFFPAQSVAYIEIGHPGNVLAGFQTLFGGRVADTLLKSIHDRQDRAKNLNELKQARIAAQFELLFSPDLANELKRIGPIGIGILELTPEQSARYGCVVALNDSSGMRLMIQNYLATGGVRRVGEIEGLVIYQQRDFAPQTPQDNIEQQKAVQTNAKKIPQFQAKLGESELTFALMQDYFLIASDRAAIAEMLKRIKGEATGESLADSPRFKQHDAVRRFLTPIEAAISGQSTKGSLFFYADSKLAFEQLTHDQEDGALIDALAMMQFVAGKEWLGPISGTLELSSKEVVLRLGLETDANPTSPLTAWVTERRAAKSYSMLPVENTAWSVSMPLPGVSTQLAALDAIAKAQGRLGELPSNRLPADHPLIQPWNKAGCVNLSMPSAKGTPIALFAFNDPVTAAAALQSVPQALAIAFNRAEPLPSASEQVSELRLYSVPGTQLPDGKTIYYLQQGSTIAISANRDDVLSFASRQPIQHSSEERTSLARFQFRPSLFVVPESSKPKTETVEPLNIRSSLLNSRYSGSRNGQPMAVSIFSRLNQLLSALPPVTGTINESKGQLAIELTMPIPDGSLLKAWEKYLDWIAQQPDGKLRLSQGYDVEVDEQFDLLIEN